MHRASLRLTCIDSGKLGVVMPDVVELAWADWFLVTGLWILWMWRSNVTVLEWFYIAAIFSYCAGMMRRVSYVSDVRLRPIRWSFFFTRSFARLDGSTWGKFWLVEFCRLQYAVPLAPQKGCSRCLFFEIYFAYPSLLIFTERLWLRVDLLLRWLLLFISVLCSVLSVLCQLNHLLLRKFLDKNKAKVSNKSAIQKKQKEFSSESWERIHPAVSQNADVSWDHNRKLAQHDRNFKTVLIWILI